MSEGLKKYETATHAALPMLVMLLIEMSLNHYAAPAHSIFLSPYLLAIFVACAVWLVVFWKGQICPGQRGRLLFVVPFVLIFVLGNLLYTALATPKHTPMYIVLTASLLLPLLFLRLPEDDESKRLFVLCGLGMALVGVLQYLLLYWAVLPSLFNGIRANNFAQLLLGLILAGWYLMLANSRLEGFFRLLLQVAALVLVLNYVWTVFVLWQQWQIMPEMSVALYLVYFVSQFLLLAVIAWLLLSKKEKAVKNPLGWSLALGLALLYPFTNML